MLDRKSIAWLAAGVLLTCVASVQAQIVPGSGQELKELNDDFEDPNWNFTLNLPKASTNIDKVDRQPAGFSANGMWFESTYRGTPDFVKRVETPAGGLRGSQGAMAMQTLYSGIPGQLSNKFQQDDLIANVSNKLGFMIPASWTPSYVCRVYIPPFETWEQRNGSSFGFRADCQTILEKPTRMGKLFRTGGVSKELEQYWPGFFIQYNGKSHPQHPSQNTAMILIRSGVRGEDVPGPTITRPGWWTLGMTITPDGKVHYYGHEGVANLGHRDHLYSNFPYGYKCLQTSTYFFNIVNQDDGRTWSTRWIVDDPKVYVATRPYTPQTAQAQVATQPVSQTRTTPPAAPQIAPPTPPAVPAKALPAARPPVPALPATPALVPPMPALPSPAVKTPVTQPATQPALQPVIQPQAQPAAQLPALQSVAPQTPALPALPQETQTPAIVPPAVPTTPAAPESKPAVNGIPALNGSITPVAPALSTKPSIPLISRTKPATAANSGSSKAIAGLPPLLASPTPVTPMPVTPTKGPDGGSPPALLPEESNSESAPLIAPVISDPVPAPMALPKEDAPVLPMITPATDASAPSLQPPSATAPSK